MTFSEIVHLLSSHMVPIDPEGNPQQTIPLLEKFVNKLGVDFNEVEMEMQQREREGEGYEGQDGQYEDFEHDEGQYWDYDNEDNGAYRWDDETPICY